jgi:hypothetical protein
LAAALPVIGGRRGKTELGANAEITGGNGTGLKGSVERMPLRIGASYQYETEDAFWQNAAW